MKIETIETPRLALRGFTPEDAPFAISLWNDPVTGRWLSDPALEAIPDIEAYTKSVEGLGDSLDCCHLVAVDRATGQRDGTCSLVPENGRRRPRPPHTGPPPPHGGAPSGVPRPGAAWGQSARWPDTP